MSHVLHRRRGHDSEYDEEEEDEGSIITEITTDFEDDDDEEDEDEDDEDFTTDDESEQSESEQEAEKEPEEDSDQKSDEEDSKAGTDEKATIIKEEEQQNEIQDNDTLTAALDETDQQPAITEISYQELRPQQQQEKEKTIHELREYRRKLAEDPSFVPYVGQFWGHDDRYREDSLAETRESALHFSTASTAGAAAAAAKKSSYDRNLDPLMYKKWDHSGYEELLRMDEEDERRKREMLESGQSPEQHNNRPRHNNHGYHNFNNGGRGNGSRSGRGRNNRTGGSSFQQQQQQQQQNRHGSFQKRAHEGWPQLSASAASPGNTVDQSLSDSPEKSRVNAWGSVDRAKEIEPIVSGETTAAAAAVEGWGPPLTITSPDGWGPHPSTATSKKADAQKNTNNSNDTSWDNNVQKEESSTTENTSEGWGPKSESSTTDIWKAPTPDKSAAAAATESSHGWGAKVSTPLNNDGWGKPPTFSNNDGWGKPPKNNVSSSSSSSNSWKPVPGQESVANDKADQEQVNTTQDIAAADGWGVVQEKVPAKDSLAATADDWKTSAASQWNTGIKHSSSSDDDDAEKKGPSRSLRKQEIPAEERASLSWASVNNNNATSLDVKNHDRSGSSRRRQLAAKPTRSSSYGKQQTSSRTDQATNTWTTPAPVPEIPEQSGWGTVESVAEPSGWGTVESTVNETAKHSGWTEARNKDKESSKCCVSATKSSQGAEVFIAAAAAAEAAESSRGVRPALNETNLNMSWKAATSAAAEEAPKSDQSSSSNHWNESAASFDQSHSFAHEDKGGWANNKHIGRSSTDWKADEEWISNKAHDGPQQQQQQKRGRGYFSTRIGSHVPESTVTPEESNTPETSAWGNFQSTGDDDSDVEIILEAEEEHGWVKDEQVLGMTAPSQYYQASYSPRTASKQPSYLRHNSGSSSPRPDQRANGNSSNGNYKPPPRNFDDSWRQQRDEAETYHHPMYYPAPHHSAPSPMNGNITYMSMIPAGNGNAVYAVPFPMGSSPSGGNSGGGVRSLSPLQLAESSSTSPPPNLQQHQQQFYTPSPPPPPNMHPLPPGYEANGMVYYGMNPSAMYPPPQPYYYYAPPMIPTAGEPYTDDHLVVGHSSMSPPNQHNPYYPGMEDDDGWGPTPETVETEEQWTSRSPQNDYQHRKQPMSHYHYPQQNHHY
ncbi:hypothetical protein [Parasitella parasitica]|uniref:Btz domain-containing protein n=1 Tax=Parasitella parasitica TaxID=35722 RepID=A0A0B7NEP2_9FUNG|nr:hypothetical protein [Parasitella parasitica]